MKKYELLNLLKKEQLQVILRYHKQYISGNKGDLIDRVLEHVDLHGALNTLGYQEIKDLCHYFNIKYNLKDKAIDDILTALHNTSKDTQKEKYSDNEFELAMDELNSLTGLYEVKRKINQLIGYIKVQDERKMRGLEYVTVGKHLVFTGNPGTGKTTVARIIGRLYKSMGVVSNGHFREVTRADLVGKYIGHSEEITQKILNEAKGGILFIDEAYSLSNGLDSDFGRVVIETLLTALENYRDDMAIIVAGYKKEMDLFLQSNPGLRSRFNIFIDFNDYTEEELLEIISSIADKNDYLISKDLREKLIETFSQKEKNHSFSNGRLARNIFEAMILNQGMRLKDKSEISDEDLKTLELEDLN